jgi:holin-like protein
MGNRLQYLKQFSIILLICLIGEVLHAVIPLPIPASIYGLVLMLICLISKIIPEEKIAKTSDFLIQIMPVMFIPSAAGLLGYWDALKPILLAVVVITVVSNVLVFAVSGRVTQAIIGLENKKEVKK